MERPSVVTHLFRQRFKIHFTLTLSNLPWDKAAIPISAHHAEDGRLCRHFIARRVREAVQRGHRLHSPTRTATALPVGRRMQLARRLRDREPFTIIIQIRGYGNALTSDQWFFVNRWKFLEPGKCCTCLFCDCHFVL